MAGASEIRSPAFVQSLVQLAVPLGLRLPSKNSPAKQMRSLTRPCARICARVLTFLLAQYESLLNPQFARFTWQNEVELMCNEKQRNRKKFNFKSVTSTSAIWETTSVGRKTIVVRRLNVIQKSRSLRGSNPLSRFRDVAQFRHKYAVDCALTSKLEIG